jgi:hypothetical protein
VPDPRAEGGSRFADIILIGSYWLTPVSPARARPVNEKLELCFEYARGHDGRAQRHDELRKRAQSPERKVAHHRRLAVRLGIDPSDVKAHFACAIAELTGTGETP